MKKNKMMRIASVLLVAVLLSTCAISGTFAKYTTSATGTDEARVAKWDIKLNGGAMSNTFTFDLFKTINDSDGVTAETDIKPTDGSIIAPGTSGSFNIILKNDSEVTAMYGIDYTVANDDSIPIEFCVDGSNWTDNLADVAASEATELAIDSAAKTITVQWRWAFGGDDATDTTLGLAGTAKVTVTAAITVEQVD